MILSKLILYFLIGFCFFKIFQMFHTHYKHVKTMKKINEFSDFHKKLLELANQIQDQKIRQIFLQHCISLMNYDTSNSINKFDKQKEMKIITAKFGTHIPELLQEHRQKQLEKLL